MTWSSADCTVAIETVFKTGESVIATQSFSAHFMSE